MTMAAAGVAKLIEECGELQQALGKKLAWWDTDDPHWDGSILSERIQDEMGDVIAAIELVKQVLQLDGAAIDRRVEQKVELFMTWQDILDNNDHGIDANRKWEPGKLTGQVEELRRRLSQSEWIVCSEALRILDGGATPWSR